MFFNDFVTTDAEINICPHIVLTDIELEWDTHDLEMTVHRPYRDNAVRVNATTAGDKIRLVAVEHESDLF